MFLKCRDIIVNFFSMVLIEITLDLAKIANFAINFEIEVN